jgi:hypothetical protein
MSLIPAETVVLSPPSVRTRPMDGRIVCWAITLGARRRFS